MRRLQAGWSSLSSPETEAHMLQWVSSALWFRQILNHWTTREVLDLLIASLGVPQKSVSWFCVLLPPSSRSLSLSLSDERCHFTPVWLVATSNPLGFPCEQTHPITKRPLNHQPWLPLALVCLLLIFPPIDRIGRDNLSVRSYERWSSIYLVDLTASPRSRAYGYRWHLRSTTTTASPPVKVPSSLISFCPSRLSSTNYHLPGWSSHCW